MPEQMSADFEQVMAQCSRGCFTGLLRVRTREGNGEVRFLSGIQDGVRFDTIEGDAALERLQAAPDPEFEAISSLPPIGSSNESVPIEGQLQRYHAAQLMHYCESNSLTCALELEVEGRVLTARYRLGELLSVEPDSEHTARLAQAKEGLYRFRLPRFELPASVQQRRASVAPAAKPAAAKPAAAKPAAAPVAAKSAASQAETPLVGVKAVAVGAPPPSSAKSPASSSKVASPAGRVAAEPRPAAPAPRFESPAASAAVVARRDEARTPLAQPVQPRAAEPRPAAQAAAREVAAPASAARPAAPVSPVPASPPPGARRNEPQAAPRAPAAASAAEAQGQRKQQGQLDGLWVDAVKPPAQSASVEELPRGASPPANAPAPAPHAAPAAPAPQRAAARAEPRRAPAQAPAAQPAERQGSSAVWVVALVLLVAMAAAGWFVFGR